MKYSISIQDRTAFPTYYTSYTSSYSNSEGTDSNYGSNFGSYTSAVTISDGTSSTEISQEGWATAYREDTAASSSFSSSNSQEGGTTYYYDATNTTVSQSAAYTNWYFGTREGATSADSYSNTASSESSTQVTELLADTIFTQFESDYTYARNTTANVPYTSTHYIISGSGTTSVLTTDTTAVSAVGVTTDEGAATSWSQSAYTSAFSTYYDLIGVYSADTDWLWQIDATNLTPSFVTDIASSADVITVGFTATPVEVTYVSASDVSDFGNTIVIPADSSEIDYQVLFSTTTSSSTIPSGDSVSFATASTTVPVWTTDTASSIVGNDSTLITAVTTDSYTVPTWIMDTFNATVTYPYGLNTSTMALVQLSSYLTTTTLYSIPPAYLVSSSSTSSDDSGGEGASEMGQTQLGTDMFYLGYNWFGLGGGYQAAINPVAPVNAFVAPSDLRSDGNPYNFADNLSFGDTRIPYPNFAGVFSNAATPYPTGFTTTGTDGHSFRYSWSKDTLFYTESSTYEAGTSTLTDKTMTNGVFASSGPMDSYYADGGTVYGGFPAIPTAAESVYLAPRAVIGTSIATNGDSTTYRSLVTDSDYSEISETVVVEQGVPAFAVLPYSVSYTEGVGGNLLIYVRNP